MSFFLHFGDRRCELKKTEKKNFVVPYPDPNAIFLKRDAIFLKEEKVGLRIDFSWADDALLIGFHLKNGSVLTLSDENSFDFLDFLKDNEDYLSDFIDLVIGTDFRVYSLFTSGMKNFLRGNMQIGSPVVLKMDGVYTLTSLLSEKDFVVEIKDVSSKNAIFLRSSFPHRYVENSIPSLANSKMWAYSYPDFLDFSRKIRDCIISLKGFDQEIRNILETMNHLPSSEEGESLPSLMLRSVVYEHTLMLWRKLVQQRC